VEPVQLLSVLWTDRHKQETLGLYVHAGILLLGDCLVHRFTPSKMAMVTTSRAGDAATPATVSKPVSDYAG
jgi:hypothetical protein